MKRLSEVVNQTLPMGMVYNFRRSLPLHFARARTHRPSFIIAACSLAPIAIKFRIAAKRFCWRLFRERARRLPSRELPRVDNAKLDRKVTSHVGQTGALMPVDLPDRNFEPWFLSATSDFLRSIVVKLRFRPRSLCNLNLALDLRLEVRGSTVSSRAPAL
jgi:hypothetical protein